MSDKTNEVLYTMILVGGAYVAGLVLGAAIGAGVTEKAALRRGFAHHDIESGKFTWNQPAVEGKP